MRVTLFYIIIITILSQIFGFIRELSLAYFYGTSAVSDAFLISIYIPSFLFAILSASIGAGFIPIYNELKNSKGKIQADQFAFSLGLVIFIFSIVIFVFGIIFTGDLVSLFAPGFTVNTSKMAINFTKISMFSIIFMGLISILSALYRINGKYLIPSLIGLPLNLIMILFFILSDSIGLSILYYGFAAGIISQFFFLLLFIRKLDFNVDFAKFKFYKLISFFKMSIPLLISVSALQLNLVIDRAIASGLSEGGISAINYATKLTGFVQAVFILSLSNLIFPKISNLIENNENVLLIKLISKSIYYVTLISIPIIIVFVLYSNWIVEIIYGIGAFDISSIEKTSGVLLFYSISIFGFGLRNIFIQIYHSYKDTLTPTINSIIGILVNIFLNVVLSKYYGINGLAIATSISSTLIAVLMLVSLKKKSIYHSSAKLLKESMKLLPSFMIFLLSGIIIKNTNITFAHSTIINIIKISFTIVLFIISLILTKDQSILYLINKIKIIVFKRKI